MLALVVQAPCLLGDDSGVLLWKKSVILGWVSGSGGDHCFTRSCVNSILFKNSKQASSEAFSDFYVQKEALNVDKKWPLSEETVIISIRHNSFY